MEASREEICCLTLVCEGKGPSYPCERLLYDCILLLLDDFIIERHSVQVIPLCLKIRGHKHVDLQADVQAYFWLCVGSRKTAINVCSHHKATFWLQEDALSPNRHNLVLKFAMAEKSHLWWRNNHRRRTTQKEAACRASRISRLLIMSFACRSPADSAVSSWHRQHDKTSPRQIEIKSNCQGLPCRRLLTCFVFQLKTDLRSADMSRVSHALSFLLSACTI